MTTIEIGLPTQANMDAAMASVGFTKTEESGSSKYTWESQGLAYVIFSEESSYNYMRFYYEINGGARVTSAALQFVQTSPYKMTYETLANGGIIIGFSVDSSVKYHFAWIAPDSAGDDWVAIAYKATTECNIVDYSLPKAFQITPSSIYQDAQRYSMTPYSDDIQIVQFYNTARFLGNLFVTLLAPSMVAYTAVRASIGNDTYLIWNFQNTATHLGVCYALKL